MKIFLASIPSKLKATYIVWLSVHLILYIASGNFLILSRPVGRDLNPMVYIYPRNHWSVFAFDISYYDLSDFSLYIVLPLLVYFIYYYWKMPNK